jgi:hypothetical protein
MLQLVPSGKRVRTRERAAIVLKFNVLLRQPREGGKINFPPALFVIARRFWRCRCRTDLIIVGKERGKEVRSRTGAESTKLSADSH